MTRRPLAGITLICLLLFWSGSPGLAEEAPALRKLPRAIRAQPENPQAYYDLGLGYENSGDPEKAIKAFQQAIRLDPRHAGAYYELGKMKGALGDSEAAIKALKQAISLRPDQAEFRARLSEEYDRQGLALMGQGRAADAVAAFQESLGANPNNEAARNNLGVIYVRGGRLGDAVGAFQEVIRLNPDNATAHYNLGVAYHLMGYEVPAYAEFLLLKELDPAAAAELSILMFLPKRKSDAK